MTSITNLVVGNCEGGLAELLRAEERALTKNGINAQTLEIPMPDPVSQAVSDAMHHLGYDSPPYDEKFNQHPASMTETLLRIARSADLSKLDTGNVVIAHDAQAAGFTKLLSRQVRSVVWRHHLGTDPDRPRTQQFWEVLRPLLEASTDLVITHDDVYNPSWMEKVLRVEPGIDRSSTKNAQELGTKESFNLSFKSAVFKSSTTYNVLQNGSAAKRSVSISRWAPLKAPISVFHTVLKAMETDHDFEHLMIGPVPSDPAAHDIFATISKLHQQLPVGTRNRFHLVTMKESGTLRADRFLRSILRTSDVFLALSLQEGFGLSVTEALNHGVAVVGRNVGGIARQIKKTGGGVLGRTEPEFVDLLLELLSNSDMRTKKSNAGREGVQRFYCSEKSAKCLIEGLKMHGTL